MLMIVTFSLNAGFNLVIGLLMAKFLGPGEFGRYALAQSIGIVFNTIFLDWLRHVMTRFYGDRLAASGVLRATLDLSFAGCSLLALIAAALGALLGFDFGLSLGLLLIAPLIGISYGVFDYSTAMLRAGFKMRPYAIAIIGKNLVSLILMLVAAVMFKSALLALAGLALSCLSAILPIARSVFETRPRLRDYSLPQVRIYLSYALPIVLTNLLIQLMPLFNRTYLATHLGFAASGQYSLGYDLGLRLMAAIGSAVDILLLQLAIRAEHEQGAEEAKRRLSINIVIVMAVLAPTCLGFWLILPSFEAVLIPDAYHRSFSAVFTLLLPGFFAFGMIFYALNPVLMVARKTWPLALAGLAALLLNLCLVYGGAVDNLLEIAWIQSLALIAAFCVIGLFIAHYAPILPRLPDLFSVSAALLAMLFVALPLRSMPPGPETLMMTIGAGSFLYAASLYFGNAFGLRRDISDWFRRRSGEGA